MRPSLDDAQRTPPRPAEIAPTLSHGPLIVTHAYFHGPLPPPAVIEQYERAVPGSAERILTLAEEQQHLRHRVEEKIVTAAIATESRGQWLAFIIVLAGMGSGSWLTVTGHSAIGLISSLTPLGAVAGAFLHSSARRADERSRKHDELQRAQTASPV